MTLFQNRRTFASLQDRRAFTLLEVLVVVAIIVALAGTGIVMYVQQLDNANRKLATQRAKALQAAAEMYATDHNGDYPATLETLLVRDDAGGPYVKTANELRDPWNKEFQYQPRDNGQGVVMPYVHTVDKTGREIGSW